VKKKAWKVILHILLGFAALFLFNAVGGRWGLGIGLNAVNACTVGVLGVCGFALLLILQTMSQ
jgi:inhibitor of the pro-sigma K processing machinery